MGMSQLKVTSWIKTEKLLVLFDFVKCFLKPISNCYRATESQLRLIYSNEISKMYGM